MKSFLPSHSLIFAGSFLFISTAVPITSIAISFNSVAFRSWVTSIFSSVRKIENLLGTVFPAISAGTNNIKNSIVDLFTTDLDWKLNDGMYSISGEFQKWFQWAKDVFSNLNSDTNKNFSFTSIWEFTKVFWSWLFSDSQTNFNWNTLIQIIKNDQFFNLLSAFRTIFANHPNAFSNMQAQHVDQLLKYFAEVATPDKQDKLTQRIKTIFENSKKIQNQNFGQDFDKLLKALVMEEPKVITILKQLIDSVIDEANNLLFTDDESSKNKMDGIKQHVKDIIDGFVLDWANKFV